MCGRYFLEGTTLSADAFREFFLTGTAPGTPWTNGDTEITPGSQAPALIRGDGSGELQRMRWGFDAPRGTLVINARVETIGERPMFRGLGVDRRCALPASRYFEWRRADRQKYSIRLESRRLFFLAGLYRFGAGAREFVVLTQSPVARVAAVHDRMPLILDTREALRRWLEGDVPLFSDDDRVRVEAEGPEQLRMALEG